MNLFAKKQSPDQSNRVNQSVPSGNTMQPACRPIQELLSEYVDNSLSARQAWEVEKHLAGCKECAEASRQMQATVELLRGASRFDTGDDFMARLHARLDVVTPQLAHKRTVGEWTREMLGRAQEGFAARRLPALNLGLAGAGVAALLLLVPRPAPLPATPDAPAIEIAGSASSVSAHENLQRNVALTANDPLGDIAAETLENVEGTPASTPGTTPTVRTNGS